MDNTWQSVQDLISTKIPKDTYEVWLENTSAEIIDNTVFIKVPNLFARDWIERHYKGLISGCLHEVTGKNYELIVVDDTIRTIEIGSDYADEVEDGNNYDKLINLIKEQSNLLRNQQDKIDSLEKRVNDLEMKFRL